MELETRVFSDGRWSAPLPSSLDSDRTVVLAFGAPEYGKTAEPWRELRAAFPRAKLLGCSTAGEILGTRIHDASVVIAVARFEYVEPRLVSAPTGPSEAS